MLINLFQLTMENVDRSKIWIRSTDEKDISIATNNESSVAMTVEKNADDEVSISARVESSIATNSPKTAANENCCSHSSQLISTEPEISKIRRNVDFDAEGDGADGRVQRLVDYFNDLSNEEV